MVILLLHLDSKLPNLTLMGIAARHRELGGRVSLPMFGGDLP